MSGNKKEVNTGVLAYYLKIRKKGDTKNFLPTERIFEILKTISKLNYNREDPSSKVKPLKDHLISLEFPNNIQKNLNNKLKLTEINFFIGRESHENFKTRNNIGEFEVFELEDEKNFCFNTHGKFMFKKENDEWYCILLLERRSPFTINVHAFVRYLEFYDNEIKINIKQILGENNYIETLNSLKNIHFFRVKNQTFKPNEREGNILSNTYMKASTIEITDVEGETPVQQFLNFLKGFWKKDISLEDKEEITEMALDSNLIIVAKKEGDSHYRSYDILKNNIIYRFTLDLLQDRNVDLNQFYGLLRTELGNGELERLVALAIKFDNQE